MNAIISNRKQISAAVKIERSLSQNRLVSPENPCARNVQNNNNGAIQGNEAANYQESLMREMLYFDRF